MPNGWTPAARQRGFWVTGIIVYVGWNVTTLIGALVEVGSGRRDIAWLEQVTAAAVRGPGLPVLPPGGLTLEEVGYPADTGLATRAEEARTVRTLTA